MAKKNVQELSFEAAFQELEETVRKLESGDLSLEDSIALFERGTQLAQWCQTKLEQAELKVQQLVPSAAGGYELAPLEEGEE